MSLRRPRARYREAPHRAQPAHVLPVVAGLLLLIGCSQAADDSHAPAEGPTGTPAATNNVELVQVASGLNSPVGIVNAADDSGRLFVVERGGRVRVIDAGGYLRAGPFVNLSDRIVAEWEQGLLGLAFHPDFAANGRLFVDYTRRGDGALVLSELAASRDRASADPASERVLLTIAHPSPFHNGGQLAFGPDGYLYIGVGDGGGEGDPLGSGQNLETLLGKILRIDVDGEPAPGAPYAIPRNNPYAPDGIAPGAGLPEIWAFGLRNPWRFSFDRASGDLYIGDVGQDTWEEIDRQAAASAGGENYGWNAREGNHCYSPLCDRVSAVDPIAEYAHDPGCAVIGGYVYRGSSQPTLAGSYLFGDHCAGTIFSLPAAGRHDPKVVVDSGLSLSAFGEAEDGEIYVVDLAGGGLYRVTIGG